MKKILLLILLCPFFVSAKTITYKKAQEIVKEVMADYYIKGDNFQYNFSRVTYGEEKPEDATSQDTKYMVCAAYTYDVHAETFGMYYSESSPFPRYNESTLTAALNYYNKYHSDKSKMNGNYLVYYRNKKKDIKYVYGGSFKFEDFVNLIQPGDIFAYSGHSLIAYDVVTHNGKKDVLILNSTRSSRIYTPIAGTTTPLIYDSFAPSKNGVLEIAAEGTVKYKWLSNESVFTDGKTINCTKNECLVLRTYYKDGSNAKFNYTTKDENINRSELRLAYSGLKIEKTVNKGDNNSIHLGDTLTYSIKITNNSNITRKNITYSSFNIEEKLGSYVSFVSANNGGTYSNSKVKWVIKSLAPNKTITLQYKVKVKSNYSYLNKTVTADGKFYGSSSSIYIATGLVENKIVNNFNKEVKSYSTCFTSYKSKLTGLELIDKVVECATGKNVKIKSFTFDSIFTRKTLPTTRATENTIALKSSNSSNKTYLEMILNNYWSGLVVYKLDGKQVLDFPRWSGSISKTRNKTISKRDFKNGDVLIYSADSNSYTKENGIYAYIYLDGKFVGVNYSGTKARNEFTYNYYTSLYTESELTSKFYGKYKSVKTNTEMLEFINYQTLYGKNNYVIFRPSLVIKQIDKIKIGQNPQLEYYLNDKSINLNGTITVMYSNGSTSSVNMTDKSVTVSGFDTKTVGTKKITVKYKEFSTTYNITVKEKETPKTEAVITCTNKVYNGQNQTIAKCSGGTIANATKKEVGNYTVTCKGDSTHKDAQSKSCSITKGNISSAIISTVASQKYTGKEIKPIPTVSLNGKTLVNNTDYTLSYKNNVKVGTATITVTGKGNYTGSKETTFKIVAAESPKTEAIITCTNKVYNGQNQIIAECSGGTIANATKKEVGSYTVTCKGDSTHTDAKSLLCSITAANISEAEVSKVADQKYTGKAITPSVTIKIDSYTLVKDKDYTLNYAKNVNVGTAVITIAGKGNYKGTKEITFKIIEASSPKTPETPITPEEEEKPKTTKKPKTKVEPKEEEITPEEPEVIEEPIIPEEPTTTEEKSDILSILDNDIIKDFWPIGAVALAFLLLIIINQIKKH